MPLRFTSLPLRSLRHRSLRSLFTIVGVAVAVGGLTTLTGLGRGLEEAWNRSLTGQGTHLLGYRKGSMDILTGSLDQELAAAMRTVAGIADVAPELVDLVTLESGDAIVVRGWEDGSHLWRTGTLLAGRRPSPGAGGEVWLGESLASVLDLGPGGEVAPFGARLRVVGVARLVGALNNHSLIMPLEDLQRLLDRPGKVTAFNIRVAQDGDADAVAAARRRLAERFPQLAFTEADVVPQRNEMYRVWRGMAWAVSVVGLAMGLVIVLNTLLIAVLERTREIGVLIAVGWPRRRILLLIVLESLALTLAGGLLGLAFSALALEILAGHPKLRGFVAVSPSLPLLLQHLAAAVLLGIVGAVYPAIRALRLNPVDALREP
jgi:putative ABC transport system permease protein